MTALLVQLADAITEDLALATFPVSIDPVRSYADWEIRLDGPTDILVDVVPVRREASIATRMTRDHHLTVHIGVRRKFDQTHCLDATGRLDPDLVDQLMDLVEKIEQRLDQPSRQLPEMAAANIVSIGTIGDYDREMLMRNRQFVSVIEAKYRVERETLDFPEYD